MRDKDQLMKHSAIMLLATVFSGAFNWGYQIVMNRMLGPEGFGILFSLLSLFMIISLPATTIQTVIVKYISRFRTQNQLGKISYLLMRFLKKLSLYFGILLIIYLLCSRLIAAFLNIPMIMPVIIIGVILYFGLLFPIGFGALQGTEKFAQLGIIYITSGFLRLVFGAGILYFINKTAPKFGVDGALIASILSGIFIFVFCYWFLRDILGFRPYNKDIQKADIYRYFIPVGIAYFFFGIITYIDVLIVKHYFPPIYAGYYSSVSMIGKAFLFVPMALTGAMFPKVSAGYEKGGNTGNLLKKSIFYNFVICTIGILICILFPKAIIYVLMAKQDITREAMQMMIPLLRFIGFAVIPYGVSCIILNYHLARHQFGFLPFFVLAGFIQISLLILFHHTLLQILVMLFIAGIFVLGSVIMLKPGRFIIDQLTKRH